MNEIVFILISFLLMSFFSGMKTAFLFSNKLRMEIVKKQNNISSRIITFITEDNGKFVNTMNAGIIFSLTIFTFYVFKLINLQTDLNMFVSSIISVLTVFVLYAFPIELFPATIFRYSGASTLKFTAVPLIFFYFLFYPFLVLSEWITKTGEATPDPEVKPGNNTGHNESSNDNPAVGTDNQADSRDNELKLFLNALDFGNTKTRECMVPRTEIEAVNKNISLPEITKSFIKTGYSKILVIDSEIDNVLGYVRSHDLFKKPGSVMEMVKKLPVVPENMSAQDLLKMLISEKKSIALVVDEFGGTAGLVSIEDVLEEIFGEIEDEFDTVNLVENKLDDGSYIFSGRIEIDHLNENYDFQLETSDEYETLAGYIIHHHGKIPSKGEIISGLGDESTVFKILKTGKTRIEMVKIMK